MGKTNAREDTSAPTALTAVVIADSFSDDFKPLTLELPRCLLPVAGVPLLDYAMEGLVQNGVEEIIVLSCAHSEKVSAHVESVWRDRRDVKVDVVVALGCGNLGDALRRLNDTDVLRSDFILCPGDIISNVSHLRSVWVEHCRRRELDPTILMTLFLKEDTTASVSARHSMMKQSILMHQESTESCDSADYATDKQDGGSAVTKVGFQYTPERAAKLKGVLGEERVSAVLDPITGNLLQYVMWPATGAGGSSSDDDDDSEDGDDNGPGHLDLSLELLAETPTLSIRNDLTETGICICSLQVLEMFEQQGFDYRGMRDCVKSVINDGLLGNKIITELVPAQRFLRRARTMEQYHNITKAVIEGWAFPFLVDGTFAAQYHNVYSRQPSVFIDKTSVLAHSCKTGRTVVVGPEASIGDHSLVAHSTVGRGTKIGKHTTVKECQLWDDVVVGDGCSLEGAVVCSGAVIGDNCKLHAGCVVSFGVKLAPGTELASGQRVTRVKESELDEFGEAISTEVEYIEQSEVEIVGETGVGRAFSMSLDVPLDARGLSLPLEPNLSSSASAFYVSNGDSDDDQDELPNGETFLTEVVATVKRAVSDGLEFDGVHVEINSVKFSYNVSILDCCCAILLAFLQIAAESNTGCPRKAFSKLLKKWGRLLDKFHDVSVESELLITLTDFSKTAPPVFDKVGEFMHAMYDNSLISEDTIFAWEKEMLAKQAAKTIDPQDDEILSHCDSFLELLRESSEDTDSD